MDTRKAELRGVILDIIAGREQTSFEPTQLGNLLVGVAEVFDKRLQRSDDSHAMVRRHFELEYEDKLLAQEIFWDLIVERIITPGWDYPNSELPFFRVHSESKLRDENRR